MPGFSIKHFTAFFLSVSFSQMFFHRKLFETLIIFVGLRGKKFINKIISIQAPLALGRWNDS